MEHLEQAWQWVQTQTADFGWIEWGIIGATGTLLLSLPFLTASNKRPKQRHSPAQPLHIAFHSFQIAPLGRDAILRIHNTRETVTLLSSQIKGSKNIVVKNALAGHELATGKVYGLMMEVVGKDRMLPDFEVVLTYMDTARNVYRQSFFPEWKSAKPPRRIKRG